MILHVYDTFSSVLIVCCSNVVIRRCVGKINLVYLYPKTDFPLSYLDHFKSVQYKQVWKGQKNASKSFARFHYACQLAKSISSCQNIYT